MSTLTLDNITKVYSDVGDSIVAVDDLALDITDGELVVFVGPSGCGKSTTLRCIAGLEDVTEGDILLGDRTITAEEPQDRDIAMVFQNYALYPHMTARGNMSFGLRMATDLDRDTIDERVQRAAELMGIEDLLEKKPSDLSGGQQQRVALGRAIVREPEVFLMDEPLSNLDAKLRTTMRTEIQQLQTDLGVTTIYVTHDQTEAMTMGDRIVVLNDGKLQQIGTPLECYYEPENLFVADFIGEPSMNFFDLRASGQELEGDVITYTISDKSYEQIQGHDRITLGIRPEDIEVVDEDVENSFVATVDVIEPMGDQNFLHLTLGETEVTATVDGDYAVTAGADIRLHFPEHLVHLFDAKTGDALVNCNRQTESLPTIAGYEGETA